jgi:hypothetical protein
MSDPFKTIGKLQEAARAVQLQLDPFRHASQALAAQLRSSELLRSVTDLETRFAQSPIARAFEHVRELDRHLALASRFTEAARIVEHHLRPLNAVSGALQSLDVSVIAQLRADVRTWDKLALANEVHSLGRRAFGWQLAVGEGLHLAHLTSAQAGLAPVLLRPPRMLTGLARRTAGRIARSSDPTERARLEASVEIVEAQVTGQLTDLGARIEGSSFEGDELAPDRRMALPIREQAEMLAAPPGTPIDAEALAATSGGVALHALARQVLALALDINLARRLKGGGDVFKLTNRVVQVAVDLPWMDVASKRALGDFVDDLYFLLYEGAGQDRLRFLQTQGGPLDHGACEIVFAIKHLRNKWLRHDAEHGDEASIRKSYTQLDGRLRALGVPGVPRRPDEFRALQKRLLEEVHAFLSRLRDALTAK